MGSKRQKEQKRSHTGHTDKDNLENRPFLAVKKETLVSSENPPPSSGQTGHLQNGADPLSLLLK